ncbi:putative DEAD-box ATP-dependent RNA helicase 36 [Blattamonas nauphoetae]|uniref:DEAD-box ATP-dependent RNA helicase 36 n=1 Tax=Blattamonas nauphoetae TaxID=2049346 RepID=A0ABQ9XP87_9EUKA|nr:putative DEAD-box ATP-dependent RNA helicase 36 [Blattamonas nauphoetae]
MTWSSLSLSPELIKQCESFGMKTPTAVQNATIPSIFRGKDVIVSAKTGSGKTAAFALPIIHALLQEPYGIFALVITPTRELASQIFDQFNAFGSKLGVKVSLVVGGLDRLQQISELWNRPHIVVCTPARLSAFLSSSTESEEMEKRLTRLRFLVLDEVDNLLSGNMKEDVIKILDHCPKKRQTLLFSATIDPEVRQTVETLSLLRPKFAEISLVVPEATRLVNTLDERYMFVPAGQKEHHLYFILKHILGIAPSLDQTSLINPQKPSKKIKPKSQQQAAHNESKYNFITIDFSKKNGDQLIIFVNKKATADIVHFFLSELLIKNVCYHGEHTMFERTNAINAFKSGMATILVTTDVAARGLDIPNVTLVINFDLPKEPQTYVHRVGRTIRQEGLVGHSISIITQLDVGRVHEIEEFTHRKMVDIGEWPNTLLHDDLLPIETAKSVAHLRFSETQLGEKEAEKRKDIDKMIQKRKRTHSESDERHKHKKERKKKH